MSRRVATNLNLKRCGAPGSRLPGLYVVQEMKIAFQILKDKPTVKLAMTRDSVCAGDDCDAPHHKELELFSFLDSEAFARAVSTDYLPSVAGYGHSWTCMLNGRKIAVIGTSGIKPLIEETPFEDDNKVHFVYHSATY